LNTFSRLTKKRLKKKEKEHDGKPHKPLSPFDDDDFFEIDMEEVYKNIQTYQNHIAISYLPHSQKKFDLYEIYS
jgi:hypothetical protein